jgi:hypothetical protein
VRVFAILAETGSFFAISRRFTVLISCSTNPLVVYDHQESSGKTRYSALVGIQFLPAEEWQESALILLNLATSGFSGAR